MDIPRKAAIRHLFRSIVMAPCALFVRVKMPNGVLKVTIPAKEAKEAKEAPAQPPPAGTHLTDAEEEVAIILAGVPNNAGLQAKEVAARLKPKVDVDTVAMRLRRMRKRGLVEHVPGSGFRLIPSLFAELTTTEQE